MNTLKQNLDNWLFLLAVCLVLIFSCKQAKQNTGLEVKTDSVVSIDRTMIHYEYSGHGEPALVFIHGWECDRSYWNKQVSYFSAKNMVVAIDLAGHGESGLSRENYTIQAYGADVASVINKLNPGKIVLIGHSMGGAVIIEASVLLRERVVALIGADTWHDLGAIATDSSYQKFVAPFKVDFVSNTNEFVRSMFPPHADSVLVDHVSKDMSTGPARVGLSSFQYLFFYDPALSLGKLDVPMVGIMCGLYPVNMERNKSLYPRFDTLSMPGVGHFVQLEDPDGFNQRVEKILDKINFK